jgi:hypothetical protein
MDSYHWEIQVRRTLRLVCVLCLLKVFWLSQTLGQQPSVPTSEAGIMAGQPFSVDVTLKTPLTKPLRVGVTYFLVPPSGAAQSPPIDTSLSQFGCYADINSGDQVARLNCSTNKALVSGEYRTDGKVTLFRIETGERKIEDDRLPIVTLLKNPDAETTFPDVAGAVLVLTDKQSLGDGATKAQDLLNSIARELMPHPPNTMEYRIYLKQRSEMARGIVKTTRLRYISGSLGAGATQDQFNAFQVPVFFDDFYNRLSKLIRELGGDSFDHSAGLQVGPPRLVLTQNPKTTDSVIVTPGSDSIEKHLKELVNILTDMRDGWKKISDSGSQAFTWSITTTPPGAEIWYSRLNEGEKKWAGLTNVKGQTLPYAIWTFRIVWAGCFQTETPDPYLQSSIDIQTSEIGCRRK